MKVFIDFRDGQFTMFEADLAIEPDHIITIDDRDWEAYRAFQKVATGWNAFLRDLSEKQEYGGAAIGP